MKVRREVLRDVRTFDELPAALRWAEEMARKGLGKGPVSIRLSRPTRSLDQNARYWSAVGDVAKQVLWYGMKMDKDAWSNVFTASLRKQRSVPNLEGNGFVVIGDSTRKMTSREMSALTELVYAFGAEKGVKWTEDLTK